MSTRYFSEINIGIRVADNKIVWEINNRILSTNISLYWTKCLLWNMKYQCFKRLSSNRQISTAYGTPPTSMLKTNMSENKTSVAP